MGGVAMGMIGNGDGSDSVGHTTLHMYWMGSGGGCRRVNMLVFNVWAVSVTSKSSNNGAGCIVAGWIGDDMGWDGMRWRGMGG